VALGIGRAAAGLDLGRAERQILGDVGNLGRVAGRDLGAVDGSLVAVGLVGRVGMLRVRAGVGDRHLVGLGVEADVVLAAARLPVAHRHFVNLPS
jgi:hypothetical protein